MQKSGGLLKRKRNRNRRRLRGGISLPEVRREDPTTTSPSGEERGLEPPVESLISSNKRVSSEILRTRSEQSALGREWASEAQILGPINVHINYGLPPDQCLPLSTNHPIEGYVARRQHEVNHLIGIRNS